MINTYFLNRISLFTLASLGFISPLTTKASDVLPTYKYLNLIAPTVEDQSFSIVEGSPSGTVVGTVNATADSEISSFSITGASFIGERENPAGDYADDPLYDPTSVFTITNEGVLRVNQPKYLLEVLGPVELEITVTDAENEQTSATISIAISGMEISITENYEINWSTLANHPQGHSEATGGIVGENLYVFSGFTTNYAPKEEVFSYAINNNTWSRLADMPPMSSNTEYGGATHMGWTTDGTVIYVAAGFAADASGNAQQFASQRVYRYIVAEDTYEELPSLPILRSAGALEYIDNKLYYVGGTNLERDEDQSDLLVLDLNNLDEGWNMLSPLPNPRNHMGSAVYNEQLYIFGGQKEHDEALVPQDDVHRYDPETDTWTHVTDMPQPFNHIHASIITYGDYIYSVGGQITHNAGAYAEVYAYAPEANEWVQFTDLPAARFSVVGGISDGKIYASGGNRSRTTYVADLPETFLSNESEVVDNVDHKLEVYPNPASDRIYVSTSGANIPLREIKLFDLNGRVVKTLDLSSLQLSGAYEMDISTLSAGFYVVQITDQASASYSKKIVIQ